MTGDLTSTLIDKKERISPYLWLMFAACFLGNVLGGAVSTLMSVYLPTITD